MEKVNVKSKFVTKTIENKNKHNTMKRTKRHLCLGRRKKLFLLKEIYRNIRGKSAFKIAKRKFVFACSIDILFFYL